VCHLLSSLYRIRQAAYDFHDILSEELMDQGFTKNDIDHAVFTYRKGGITCLTAWHVDNGLAGCNSLPFLTNVKQHLHLWFSISDMGAVSKYLGIQFEQDMATKELWLHQEDYIANLLEDYGLVGCHPVRLPMDLRHPFLRDDIAEKLPTPPDLAETYPRLVGELLYLAVCTRPDISNAVQKLSQHLSSPSPHLLATTKHLLRYLTGSAHLRLHYGPSSSMGELYGFSDADWATSPNDRVSISGYCWFFYGGMVSHSSRKQQTQALSSTKAEYMAVTATLQEGLWLCSFLQTLYQPQPTPMHIYVDNAGAIALTKEAANNHCMKHIDVHYHFCRSHIGSGTFLPEWVASACNTADIFTKLLPRPVFAQHVQGLSLVSC
jgi:Reverse transcriptase (RNA-dependent DNA polymerase)